MLATAMKYTSILTFPTVKHLRAGEMGRQLKVPQSLVKGTEKSAGPGSIPQHPHKSYMQSGT